MYSALSRLTRLAVLLFMMMDSPHYFKPVFRSFRDAVVLQVDVWVTTLSRMEKHEDQRVLLSFPGPPCPPLQVWNTQRPKKLEQDEDSDQEDLPFNRTIARGIEIRRHQRRSDQEDLPFNRTIARGIEIRRHQRSDQEDLSFNRMIEGQPEELSKTWTPKKEEQDGIPLHNTTIEGQPEESRHQEDTAH
ncbi:hypothetical protein O3P69_012998 [Scylla paramamosain]|uniref:Secreted protein n=1 Tax=Scylla paramamosain TaxID=85552 RepID=A0AAW0TRM0_SCYPA